MQLSKREQFLWGLVIGQCLVYVATMGLIESDQLLAYISFSSTIVSIILGLLAIIFSVFYSGKSSQTVDRLNGQLDNLSKIERQIEDSSALIEGSTKDIKCLPAEIRKLLEKFEELKLQHKKSTDRLESRLTAEISSKSSQSKQKAEDVDVAESADEIDIDRDKLTELMFSATSFEFDYVLGELLSRRTKADGSTRLKWRGGLSNFVFNTVFDEIRELGKDDIGDFEIHSVMTIIVIFKNLNLIEETPDGLVKFSQEIMDFQDTIQRLHNSARDSFINSAQDDEEDNDDDSED